MPLESIHGAGKGYGGYSRHNEHKKVGSSIKVRAKQKYTLEELNQYLLSDDEDNRLEHKESTLINDKSPLHDVQSQQDPVGNLEDIEMADLDNEENVEMVSNYLTDARLHEQDNNIIANDRIDQFESVISNVELATQTQTIFVVDTNFIISHLNTLEALRSTFKEFHHLIVIPSYTVRELDGLKNSEKIVESCHNVGDVKHGTNIGASARSANSWIYKHMANTASGVIGQKLRQRINPNNVKDDAILDCCIYFKEKLGYFVILLSNDKNLCLKALTEEILTVSYRKGMTGQLIASKAHEENIYRFGSNIARGVKQEYPTHSQNVLMNSRENEEKLDFKETSKHIFLEIEKLLLMSVNRIMLDEYGEEIDCLDFDPNRIESIIDISKCIYNYWVSVFSEYFRGSKLCKNDWKLLPDALTTVPNNKSLLEVFTQFWTDVLEHLFIKRNDDENTKLETMSNEWKTLIKRTTT